LKYNLSAVEFNMVCLANKGFRDNILTDILELSSTDFKFVAKDGVYRTHKLLMLSAFPALRSCFEDCIECCEELTIIIPEEPVDRVQEGIVKMILEGDLSYLETILGIKSSISLVQSKNSNFSRTKKKSVLETLQVPKLLQNISDDSNDNIDDIDEDPLTAETFLPEEIYLVEDDTNEGYITSLQKKKYQTFSCAECSKQFQYKQNLNRHMKRGHIRKKKDILCCPECGKTFQNSNNLNRHIKRGHNTKACDRCYIELSSRDEYLTHLKNCWTRCELCDWVTKYKEGEKLDAHRRRHVKEGEKNCTFVFEQLKQKEVESLKEQYEDHWKNKEKQYTERITYVYKSKNDANDSN